jgi:hypothetical protein
LTGIFQSGSNAENAVNFVFDPHLAAVFDGNHGADRPGIIMCNSIDNY